MLYLLVILYTQSGSDRKPLVAKGCATSVLRTELSSWAYSFFLDTRSLFKKIQKKHLALILVWKRQNISFSWTHCGYNAVLAKFGINWYQKKRYSVDFKSSVKFKIAIDCNRLNFFSFWVKATTRLAKITKYVKNIAFKVALEIKKSAQVGILQNPSFTMILVFLNLPWVYNEGKEIPWDTRQGIQERATQNHNDVKQR